MLPVSQSLTSDLVSEKRRGLAMGAMQAFGSNLLGGVLAPLILIALFVPDPPSKHHVITHSGEDLGVPKGDPLPISKLLTRNVVLCCLISVCLVAYNSITWYFAPLYLTQERGMTTGQMSYLVAVLGVSVVFTAFVIPGLSDKFGRKPIMVIFSLVGLLMPLSALYMPATFSQLAPGFFIGWFVLGVYPVFMAIIPVETVGPASAAKVLGLVVGSGELLGGVLGPSVAGIIADLTDLTAPFWLMAGLTLLAAILSLGLIETAPVSVQAKATV